MDQTALHARLHLYSATRCRLGCLNPAACAKVDYTQPAFQFC